MTSLTFNLETGQLLPQCVQIVCNAADVIFTERVFHLRDGFYVGNARPWQPKADRAESHVGDVRGFGHEGAVFVPHASVEVGATFGVVLQEKGYVAEVWFAAVDIELEHLITEVGGKVVGSRVAGGNDGKPRGAPMRERILPAIIFVAVGDGEIVTIHPAHGATGCMFRRVEIFLISA